MAIPLFVKVSPFVAGKMKLDKLRFKTADGNYLLRQSDFMGFGPLHRLPEYVAAVGGVILRDAEAAANVRGELNTALPEPTDPQWADPECETENQDNMESPDSGTTDPDVQTGDETETPEVPEESGSEDEDGSDTADEADESEISEGKEVEDE